MSHFVYIFLDADQTVLYVGCSGHLGRRVTEHRAGSHWFGDVASMEVRPFSNEFDAYQFEGEAIYDLAPLHNVQLNIKRTHPEEVGTDPFEQPDSARTRKREAVRRLHCSPMGASA